MHCPYFLYKKKNYISCRNGTVCANYTLQCFSIVFKWKKNKNLFIVFKQVFNSPFFFFCFSFKLIYLLKFQFLIYSTGRILGVTFKYKCQYRENSIEHTSK